MFRETGSLCLYLVSHLGKSTIGLQVISQEIFRIIGQEAAKLGDACIVHHDRCIASQSCSGLDIGCGIDIETQGRDAWQTHLRWIARTSVDFPSAAFEEGIGECEPNATVGTVDRYGLKNLIEVARSARIPAFKWTFFERRQRCPSGHPVSNQFDAPYLQSRPSSSIANKMTKRYRQKFFFRIADRE